MRNKWYFLLILVYVITFGFILGVNGVFDGNVVLTSNLVINVAFLVIIGVLFILSIASFIRLNSVTGALTRAAQEMERQYEVDRKNLWPEYRKKQEPFANALLNRQFAKYQKHVSAHTDKKGNLMQACPIEDYMNEELLNRVGRTYFNSSISGAMTGLGILGTFLGLSLGLSSFSGNDIFTISENVAPLLDGMKVAFHTSVYGIFFSLVFSFVYRSLLADAYEKLDHFLMVFREYTQPDVFTSDERMDAMLLYQSSIASSMRKIQEMMQGNAQEQIRGIEQIVGQFTKCMSETLGADFQKLGKSLERSCQAQGECAGDLRYLSENMQRMLDSCSSIQDTLRLTVERQKAVEEKLSDTCETISNELYTLGQTRDMYEK
ncbi:MotA/TolQ/ExbB proton channel family protein [Lachnospiraceae bacterium JLR.KK008]